MFVPDGGGMIIVIISLSGDDNRTSQSRSEKQVSDDFPGKDKLEEDGVGVSVLVIILLTGDPGEYEVSEGQQLNSN